MALGKPTLGIGMTSQRTRERMISRLREQGIKDELVLHIMGEIPRHQFVDEALGSRAYEDVALPIGFGQTISQPYIVARMTELLRDGKPLNKVLEIGTGCGYQTAVLSKVAKEVISVERIRPLLMKTLTLLRKLRLSNIKLEVADGSIGLAKVAPFDGIIVTAASTHLPEALLAQLTVGGRLIIPIGSTEQNLYLIERTETDFIKTKLEAVRFVPLLGGVSTGATNG